MAKSSCLSDIITQNYHNYKPTFNQYCIQSYVLYLQYIGQIIWTYCLFIKYFSNI